MTAPALLERDFALLARIARMQLSARSLSREHEDPAHSALDAFAAEAAGDLAREHSERGMAVAVLAVPVVNVCAEGRKP